MEDIKVYVQNERGEEREVIIPLGITMSLMEALKANGIPIEATCGGLALCATCKIQVIEGFEATGELTADEEAMLDSLPDCDGDCRLSCQVRVSEALHGMRFRFAETVLV